MALFGRRESKGLGWRLRQFVWPDGGIGRASRYLFERVKRMRATPHAIAAGFASGAAVSFLPLIGLHFLLGFALAWAARGSMPAAALGTAIGNPLTFPIFFSAAHRLGQWILPADPTEIAPADLAAREAEALAAGVDFGALGALWPTLKVTLIGGLPIAAAAWVGFYLFLRAAVARFQAARRARIAARSREGTREAAPEAAR